MPKYEDYERERIDRYARIRSPIAGEPGKFGRHADNQDIVGSARTIYGELRMAQSGNGNAGAIARADLLTTLGELQDKGSLSKLIAEFKTLGLAKVERDANGSPTAIVFGERNFYNTPPISVDLVRGTVNGEDAKQLAQDRAQETAKFISQSTDRSHQRGLDRKRRTILESLEASLVGGDAAQIQKMFDLVEKSDKAFPNKEKLWQQMSEGMARNPYGSGFKTRLSYSKDQDGHPCLTITSPQGDLLKVTSSGITGHDRFDSSRSADKEVIVSDIARYERARLAKQIERDADIGGFLDMYGDEPGWLFLK